MYLGCDLDLNLGPLFLFAFEDGGGVPGEILELVDGRIAGAARDRGGGRRDVQAGVVGHGRLLGYDEEGMMGGRGRKGGGVCVWGLYVLPKAEKHMGGGPSECYMHRLLPFTFPPRSASLDCTRSLVPGDHRLCRFQCPAFARGRR